MPLGCHRVTQSHSEARRTARPSRLCGVPLHELLIPAWSWGLRLAGPCAHRLSGANHWTRVGAHAQLGVLQHRLFVSACYQRCERNCGLTDSTHVTHWVCNRIRRWRRLPPTSGASRRFGRAPRGCRQRASTRCCCGTTRWRRCGCWIREGGAACNEGPRGGWLAAARRSGVAVGRVAARRALLGCARTVTGLASGRRPFCDAAWRYGTPYQLHLSAGPERAVLGRCCLQGLHALYCCGFASLFRGSPWCW